MDHAAYAEGRMEQRIGAAVLKIVDEMRPPSTTRAPYVYALKRLLPGQRIWETVTLYENEATAQGELELLQKSPQGVDWTVEPFRLYRG